MSTKDKLITSVFITLSLILACYLQSCTTSQEVLSHKYNQQVKCYHFTN
jgi:hypothetical protein